MLGLSVKIDGQRVAAESRGDLEALVDFINSYLRLTAGQKTMPITQQDMTEKQDNHQESKAHTPRHQGLEKPTTQLTGEWVDYAASVTEGRFTSKQLFDIAVREGFKPKSKNVLDAFRTAVRASKRVHRVSVNEEGHLVYEYRTYEYPDTQDEATEKNDMTDALPANHGGIQGNGQLPFDSDSVAQ